MYAWTVPNFVSVIVQKLEKNGCLLWNCQLKNLQLNMILLFVLFILQFIVKMCFPQSEFDDNTGSGFIGTLSFEMI